MGLDLQCRQYYNKTMSKSNRVNRFTYTFFLGKIGMLPIYFYMEDSVFLDKKVYIICCGHLCNTLLDRIDPKYVYVISGPGNFILI